LLAGEDDEEEAELDEMPIWLTLTTKKHIVDAKRLKPGKIALPHSLHSSATTTICLITADPQRTYKDLVASPAFPAELGARITRVIGVSKLKSKYGQYEAQRQLVAEHDMFLADDRIITQLPKILGKTFYKSSAKRPIPISIQAPAPRSDGKRIARAKGEGVTKDVITPQKLAAEIQKTFECALVALSPSTQTSVRVALASWSADKVAANIEAVSNELIEKFVPQKWRGVRAIHIKGPTTAALPIWLADELWTEETEVLEDLTEEQKAIEANVGKKRKALISGNKRKAIEAAPADDKADKKARTLAVESNDTNLDHEIALRKEKLKKQKEEAALDGEDAVPKAQKAKKARKGKAAIKA
jgi:ribosome biogenesis protein UTP30